MQNNQTIAFPSENVTPAAQVGRSRMIITHTRPSFSDSEQRMELLRDLKKNCVRLVQMQRKQVVSP